MSIKQIETHELNEAAYLYTLGITPIKVIRTAHVQATFYYPQTKLIKELLHQYRLGFVEANLTHYMYTRGVLKNMVSSQPVVKEHDQPVVGATYYYIEPITKTIIQVMYGKDKAHYQRWLDGNYFASKVDAQKKLDSKAS
jgi:hypothetical protein